MGFKAYGIKDSIAQGLKGLKVSKTKGGTKARLKRGLKETGAKGKPQMAV
jgi:hypothetical protein